jgi:hypothetical protein
MATFELTGPDGGTYHVDAPDEHAAVAAFSAFHGTKAPDAAPPPDKYQQAAIDEQAKLKTAGVDEGAGYTRRLAHGYTLGADSTILAGLQTPLEMVKHGTFSPREGYNFAKAREDQIMGDARKNTGMLGDATEMLGGAAAGGGLAGAGVTAARLLAPEAGVVARSLASAADAGGIGAVSGFNEGNGLNERLTNAAKGFGTGALIGGALPIAGAVASGVAAPIVGNLRALHNPEGFAQSQFARVIHDSGQTPQQIGQAVQDANAAGLPFTPADAMGNAGQKALAAVVRGPGEGSTDAVRFLEARQAGQGRRVANTLAEGFDAPQTAAQTEARLTGARDATANREYGAVREDAQPVDVSNVLDHIDGQVAPFNVPHDRVAPDGITGRMLAYRRMLGGAETNLDGSAAGGLNDFNATQMVRHDLSDEVRKATVAGEGNKARLLGGILRELDTSLENSSTGFRQANANFARASRDINAVDTGRTAATRGRTEDTIPAFQALPSSGQAAFRAGYVDPLIASTQGAAHGVNKARPFTSDAFREEAAAMAPRGQVVNGRVIPGANVNVAGPRMQQNLAREQTMFETRARAMGNSKTAENLADDAAMSVNPHLIGNIISGNWHGAIRNVLSAGHTAMTGNTPAVRAAVGRMLVDRGVNPANLQAAIGQTVARIQFVQNLSRNVGRGAAGALAVSRPGQTVN